MSDSERSNSRPPTVHADGRRRSLSPREETLDEDEGFEPSAEVVAAFDSLMASRLDVAPGTLVPDDTGDGAGRQSVEDPEDGGDNGEASFATPDPTSMSKAERIKAAKKRRKERDRAAKAAAAAALAAATAVPAPKPADEVVSFRLFDAVAPVSLSAEEWYPLPENPRLTPLPADVRARIARVAQDAAVDPSTFSTLSDLPADDQMRSVDAWTADTTAPLPPAFLAYTTHADTPCVALPSVPLFQPHAVDSPSKRRRRRARPFPPPQFWRPPHGVKTREYGRGWAVL